MMTTCLSEDCAFKTGNVNIYKQHINICIYFNYKYRHIKKSDMMPFDSIEKKDLKTLSLYINILNPKFDDQYIIIDVVLSRITSIAKIEKCETARTELEYIWNLLHELKKDKPTLSLEDVIVIMHGRHSHISRERIYEYLTIYYNCLLNLKKK